MEKTNTSQSILQVNELKKSFGALQVLKGISFELKKGEVLAIIGSSGSGKTTLLRCLNFLEIPDSGKIVVNDDVLYNDSDMNKVKADELRKKRLHFGLVFQSFNLFPHYNVLKNVMLAKELLAKEELAKKYKDIKIENKGKPYGQILAKKKQAKEEIIGNIEKNALELIDRVGLSDKIKSYPCELSGGQCQRVAIARALALSPNILCFDEPTSALDPELTGEVLKVIKSLKGVDRTMIIVTHEMEFARRVSDKVIFMADGVIEEMGTPEQLFENPQSEKTKAFFSKNIE